MDDVFVGVVFFVLPFIMCIILYRINKSILAEEKLCISRVNGVITDFRIVEDVSVVDDYNTVSVYVYYPVVTYSVDGTEYQGVSKVSRGNMGLMDNVVVYYNPANPSSFYIKGYSSVSKEGYFVPLIFVIVGILVISM